MKQSELASGLERKDLLLVLARLFRFPTHSNKVSASVGGRVLEVDGDTVVLDAALTLDPAITYTLTLVVPDGITKINKDGTRTTRPRLKVFDITGHQTTDSTTEVTLDEPATTQVGAIWVLEWSEKQAQQIRLR
jgi:hypothetical protein